MKKYSCSTVLQKEAATRPDPDRQPPRMMIGRLPNLFTRMLLIGPGEEQENGKKENHQAPCRATEDNLLFKVNLWPIFCCQHSRQD